MDKYTTSTSKGFDALRLYVGGQLHTGPATPGPRVRRVVAPKPAKSGALSPQPLGAGIVLDTFDLKHGNSPLQKLRKNRQDCRETALFLLSRPVSAATIPLHNAARKIKTCSLYGAFRSLSPGLNYKIGTSLCKNRLCPNCQRVLSAKRKNNFLAWYDTNKEELTKYRFYHLVLTLPHKRGGQRDNLYTSELTDLFSQLRGQGSTNNRRRRAWWNLAVAGGSFSVEIKAGRDKSPHIHIHALLLGLKPLYRKDRPSEFIKSLITEWAAITGYSEKKIKNGIHLEPVYYVDENDKKIHSEKGDSQHVDKAVAECIKYTLKADASELAAFDDSFLADLLTTRNRYYNRFGCLNPKDSLSIHFKRLDMLCTDYKDLEQMSIREAAQLLNPHTGEIIEYDTTQIAITPFSNVRAKEVKNPLSSERGGGAAAAPTISHYFRLVDDSQVLYLPPGASSDAAKHLARTVGQRYKKEADLL